MHSSVSSTGHLDESSNQYRLWRTAHRKADVIPGRAKHAPSTLVYLGFVFIERETAYFEVYSDYLIVFPNGKDLQLFRNILRQKIIFLSIIKPYFSLKWLAEDCK